MPDGDVEVRSGLGTLKLTTANDGTFFVHNMADGNYEIHARGRGGAPTHQVVTVLDGEVEPLELQLLPSASARVRVVDESSRPVVGASCVFRAEREVVRSRTPDRTDRTGSVTRAGLPIGWIRVSVRSPDGKRGSGQVQVARGKVAEVEVQVSSPSPTERAESAGPR